MITAPATTVRDFQEEVYPLLAAKPALGAWPPAGLKHPAAGGDRAFGGEQHHAAGVVRDSQHQHLGREPRDAALAQVHRRDDLPPDEILDTIEIRELRAGRFDPGRAKIDPELVGGFSGLVIGLGPDDVPDPQVQDVKRRERFHPRPPRIQSSPAACRRCAQSCADVPARSVSAGLGQLVSVYNKIYDASPPIAVWGSGAPPWGVPPPCRRPPFP